MSKTSIAVALLLSGIGCSNAEPGGAAASAATAPAQPPTSAGASGAAHARVSADYLAGPWCYRYYEAGDERSDEQVDYLFHEDGTLLYQNAPTAAMDSEGAWTLESGQLSIGPSVWVITKDVHRVEDDRLVLGHDRLQVVFERGSCAAGAAT